MNTLRFSINKNCIMGCCQTTSWKYNDIELVETIKNNNINKVIIFTPCLNKDKDLLVEILNLIHNNFSNVKIIVRTIFYRIYIRDIADLTLDNLCFVEFMINERSNFFDNQLLLKEQVKNKIIDNGKAILIANMIYNNDINYIKEYVLDKLLTNSKDKTDVIRLNTDLDINELKTVFADYNFKIDFDKNDNIIDMCYYNCSNINIYKNVIVIYIEK